MLTKPSIVIKTWSQPKIQALVNPLGRFGVSDRKRLEKIWEGQPQFLLEAYLKWVDPKFHEQVTKIWPPINDDKLPAIDFRPTETKELPQNPQELHSAEESSDDDL